MARFNRRYYESLAYAKESYPRVRYVISLIRYLFNRVLHHKGYFAMAALITFLCGTLYVMLFVTNRIEASLKNKYTSKLNKLILENQVLRSENEILQSLRADFIRETKALNLSFGGHWNPMESPEAAVSATHYDYYTLATKLERGLEDAWDFAAKSLPMNGFAQPRYFVYEWYRVMKTYVQLLEKRDLIWRNEKQIQLGNTIRSKLLGLQEFCTGKYVSCPTKFMNCGFGCLLHHLAYCLVAALALNRTMILEPGLRAPLIDEKLPLWHSMKEFNGPVHCLENHPKVTSIFWNDIFEQPGNVTADLSSFTIIKLPLIDYLHPSTTWLPLAIPEKLEDSLRHLTQLPFVLFIGHILDYVMQPNERMQAKIEEYYQQMELSKNDILVGVHIRRTDKLIEAGAYELKEYMMKVQEYFDLLETKQILTNITNPNITKASRKVYLATDDPSIWSTEVHDYIALGYHFYGNISFAAGADPKLRISNPQHIDEVLMDIWMLSKTDYLVCTMSSQLCRLAYELMQVRQPKGRDMSLKAYSLDEVYYFGGQISHRLKALVPHAPFSGKHRQLPEHTFERGDILGVSKDGHYGYFFGDNFGKLDKNNKTTSNQYTFLKHYPKFKVEENVIAVPFDAFN